MYDSILLLIFGAGVATLLSPCGYALIPAYITYSIGSGSKVRQALIRSSLVSLGVVITYTILAVLVSFLREAVRGFIPHLALLSALVVISLGVMKLLSVSLPSIQPLVNSLRLGTGTKYGGNIPFFMFGIGYGLGASGCNLPIFLVVLFYALVGEVGNPFLILMTYSLGVVVPLIIVGLVASLIGFSAVKKLAPYTTYIHKVVGAAMIIAGIYLIYFYITLISL